MNCANCGAAMELAESRRHLRCGHCGSVRFTGSIEADGVRLLGRTADASPCPACGVPMDAALLDERDPIHFCGSCRGVLLPRRSFAAAVARRRAWATGPPADPIPLDRRALDRTLACPSCRGPLETYPHAGPGNVVIDSCGACDMIWLDYGEMGRIVDAPGRDRGRGAAPIADDFVGKGTRPSRGRDEGGALNGFFRMLFES